MNNIKENFLLNKETAQRFLEKINLDNNNETDSNIKNLFVSQIFGLRNEIPLNDFKTFLLNIDHEIDTSIRNDVLTSLFTKNKNLSISELQTELNTVKKDISLTKSDAEKILNKIYDNNNNEIENSTKNTFLSKLF